MESNVVQEFIITEDKNFTPSVTFVGATTMATDLNSDMLLDGALIVDSVDENGTFTFTITDNTLHELNESAEPINNDSSFADEKDFTCLNPADVSWDEPFFDVPATELENTESFSSVLTPLSLSPAELSTALLEGNLSSDEHLSNVVSQAKVSVAGKKKRGRKPKSLAGISSLPKEKKMKVYQISMPFEDKEKEKKRLNAINAKKHRDSQKQQKESLHEQLKEVIQERDSLKKEVETLKKREKELKQQVEKFKKQVLSLMSVFQNGQ